MEEKAMRNAKENKDRETRKTFDRSEIINSKSLT